MLPSQLRGRLRIPAMAAPMFLVSGPDLVVETCKAGILGTFPTLNQRTAEGYEQWLIEIRRGLGNADCAPFGAQFGIHHTNPRQAPDLALAIRYQVPLVITTLGITRDITDAVHAYGGLVFHDATTIRHAKKALDANVDGIIAVCSGAGGHSGTYNPFAFTTELRPLLGDKTLILAGAVSNGQSIAGAIASGADMVSLGTCFITTHESMAPDAQKAMILESTINDIVYTDKISGIGASFLAQTFSRASESRGSHGVFDVAREISPKLWRDFWSAGQGVGGINSITSVTELCDRLAREYGQAVDRLTATAVAYAKRLSGAHHHMPDYSAEDSMNSESGSVAPAPEAPATLAIDGAIATITLNRPHAFNAIDPSISICLESLAQQIEATEQLTVVIVEGTGSAFCAGGDLQTITGDTDSLETVLGDMISHYHAFIAALRRMPKLVITSVQGSAAGAGLSLAFMGDLCIAADDARFIPAYGRLGVSPDGGGTIGLVGAAGPQLALRIFLAEDSVSAAQAFAWGLVAKVVPAVDLKAETRRLAERIAQNSPAAIAATKALVYDSGSRTIEVQLDAEKRSLLACTGTQPFRANVNRIIEARLNR